MRIIGRPREGIHRHGHRADLGRAKEGGDEFRGIGKYQQDAVPARHPEFEQRISHAVGQRRQFPVGHLPRLAHDRDARRMPRRRYIQKMLRHIEPLGKVHELRASAVPLAWGLTRGIVLSSPQLASGT